MNYEVAKSCVRWLGHYMAKTKVDEADDKELVGKSLVEVIRHEHKKSPDKWWGGHHF